MHLAAKLGLYFTASLFIYLTMQGMPAADGPHACVMEDNQGHVAPFHLTDHASTMLVDLGGGKVYAFPKNRELSDATSSVGAISDPATGSVSVLLEKGGHFQMTFLLPGEPPSFVEGSCK